MKKDFFMEKIMEAAGKSAKKNLDSIEFCSPSLLIKHNPTGIEYTIFKIKLHDKSPVLYAYRYDVKNPDSYGKVYIKVNEKQWSGKNPEYSKV